ncbi:MAG TPA: family 20 glycosylhydrolase [Fimbriimonadaceae bacterium]|jgi:hypothetical protein
MLLNMWMYDLAREQAPTYDHLQTFCRLSLDSGYNGLGLYLEHRFKYKSAPWIAGTGALEPETIKKLQKEFPELQIIPFINLLGHFEGFLYSEQGHQFAEEPFVGMQACPSNSDFVALAKNLINDTVEAFSSEIIHIGGDETMQLGRCPKCKAKVEEWEKQEGVDGKGKLFGEHFGPMAKYVNDLGRRPAVWGDMFLEHPQALEYMPKNTLMFDWQYFDSCLESSEKWMEKGYDVVLSPTLHVYDAAWCHLLPSEANVRQLTKEAREINAFGLCLTTWECGLFSAYDSLFPAISATGKIFSGKTPIPTRPFRDTESTNLKEEADYDIEQSLFLKAYSEENERYEVWARIMGVDLNECGKAFAFNGMRSSLKVRFLLQANPFLVWLNHHEELTGPRGDKALLLVNEALKVAPNEAAKGISLFVRSVIEFVRIVENARQEYSDGNSEKTIAKLALTRQIFDDLSRVATRTHNRIGGSLADIERCKVAKEQVERVIVRIRRYADGSLGYMPSFEHLTSLNFMPHDQAAWWLINHWAR